MPLLVFTDGASSGNPGPGGWGAVIIDETQQIRELAGSEPHTTNNRMELIAPTQAIKTIRENELSGACVMIYTDSTYVIRGITQWIRGWKTRDWKTAEGKDVLNRDLWESLEAEIAALRPRKVTWNYVPGHAGIHGNERADELSVQSSQGLTPQLYRGALVSYPIPEILRIPPQSELDRLLRERGAKKPASRSASGLTYYISVVDGALARHASWAECEARVKGVSGARYKKVASPEEETEALRGWGVL